MMNIEPGPLERLVDEENITIMKNGQKVMEFSKTDDDSIFIAMKTVEAIMNSQLNPHEVEHFLSILGASRDLPF